MNPITWNEFKNLIPTWKGSNDLMFRGHASRAWKLEPTLGRINENDFCYARTYHQKLKSFIEASNLHYPSLPENNPLLISMMIGNDEHRLNFENYINILIELSCSRRANIIRPTHLITGSMKFKANEILLTEFRTR